MVQLSFDVPGAGEPWGDTWTLPKGSDPAAVSEIDLCYRYFGVRVRFVVDQVDVISDRRYLPLVDLALSLVNATDRLSAGRDATIDFTESEEVIRLRVEGSQVAITSSKRAWRAVAGREKLVGEMRNFLRGAYSRLTGQVPGLAENPVVEGLRVE
ncbi:hypothetical protein BBK82_44340 [Lentzea guizhouensis]|uniref:Uncharacterized protein n=1 Tax=Lentzea guizhouensis TaxID=1586287 RepID=A0A1B2HW63_9PSEU|nr:hypothetical protein [Lentzea guizhouensis]ANZ41925.1 hypothetical protein BBK82_44340 [Lentzea guizhouensis]